MNEAINCPTEHHCIIEREFVDKLLSHPSVLARQARIVPSVREGVLQGYKVYGIRRGTLPKLLGLRNGDMLTSIGDHELTSIDKCMEAYSQLRRETEVEFEIVRDGVSLTKRIEIR